MQDPALLKLVHQVAAGPPDSLGSNWQQPPAILFLNKQDKLEANIRATVLQQLRQQLGGLLGFTRVFEGAAMLGQGVPELKQYLAQQVRCGCVNKGQLRALPVAGAVASNWPVVACHFPWQHAAHQLVAEHTAKRMLQCVCVYVPCFHTPILLN